MSPEETKVEDVIEQPTQTVDVPAEEMVINAYKVLKEFPLENENREVIGMAQVGAIMDIPEVVGKQMVTDGFLEFIHEAEVLEVPEEVVKNEGEEAQIDSGEKVDGCTSEEQPVVDEATNTPVEELEDNTGIPTESLESTPDAVKLDESGNLPSPAEDVVEANIAPSNEEGTN